MKNSVKDTVKSGAVTTIKTIVAPLHITLQASADLLALGEAKAINAIDGTPVVQTVMERTAFTQNKIQLAVSKAMEIKERNDAKKAERKQKHIDALHAKLDKLEGVEHIQENIVAPEPAPAVTEQPKKQSALSKKIDEVAASTPPVPPAPEVFTSNDFVTPIPAI